MRQNINIYRNKRVLALIMLCMVATVLILSECDDMTGLLVTKAAGFAIAAGTYRLGRFWSAKGKINELMSLAAEE